MKPNGAICLEPEHSCAEHDFEDVNNLVASNMQGGITITGVGMGKWRAFMRREVQSPGGTVQGSPRREVQSPGETVQGSPRSESSRMALVGRARLWGGDRVAGRKRDAGAHRAINSGALPRSGCSFVGWEASGSRSLAGPGGLTFRLRPGAGFPGGPPLPPQREAWHPSRGDAEVLAASHPWNGLLVRL